MTPFVLVITTCLSNGSDCYRSPVYQDIPQQFECQVGAQRHLVRWLEQHPKRVFKKFACVAEDRLTLFLNGDSV